MRQKSGPVKEPATQVLKNIRRATRRHFSAEDKIRIVLEGLRGEDSIAELCRREGIVQNLYYRWSKDFLEAGKKRLAAPKSEARDVTRHRRTIGHRNPRHDAAHFGTVFSLAVRKVAHRLDQIIVLLACEPRRRYAANQFLLMTGLAYRHCGGRRGGRRVLRPFRPILCRKISGCGRQLFLGEVYRDLLHDIAGALSVFEFTQLLQDVILLQTPNDWNSLQFWQAVYTVAHATNH